MPLCASDACGTEPTARVSSFPSCALVGRWALWWRTLAGGLFSFSPCHASWWPPSTVSELLEGSYGAECRLILQASTLLVAATALRTAHSMVLYAQYTRRVAGATPSGARDVGVSYDSISSSRPLSPPPSHFARGARGDGEEAGDEAASESMLSCVEGLEDLVDQHFAVPRPSSHAALASPGPTSPCSSRVTRPSRGKTRAARLRVLRYWQLVEKAVLHGEAAHTKAGSVVLHVRLSPCTKTKKRARSRSTCDLPVLFLDESEPATNLLLSSRAQLLVLATSDAQQPCFPATACGREETASSRALRHMWNDTIRYDVNADEIVTLLLAYDVGERLAGGAPLCASRPLSSRACTAGPSLEVQHAAARLAVLWYLTLLRRVYEAVAQRQDTEGCEDELAALRTHAQRLHDCCIAPLEHVSPPSETSGVRADDECNFSLCWRVLQAGESCLRRRRWRLMLSNTWFLFRYMYDSSQGKVLSAVMLFIMTRGAGLLNAAGTYLRDSVSTTLTSVYEARTRQSRGTSTLCGSDPCGPCTSSSSSSPSYLGYEDGRGGFGGESSTVARDVDASSDMEASFTPVVILCSVELLQMMLNTIVLSSTQQLIRTAASKRRDATKKELYEALTHMPLAFYDLHTYDEVEEMVYYVNDLEGVDVHIHQYVWQMSSSYLAMTAALTPLPRHLKWLVAATVLTSLTVKGLGAAVARWYNARLRDGSFARWFPWSVRHPSRLYRVRTRDGAGGDDPYEDDEDDEDDGTDDGDDEEDTQDLQENENRSSARQRDGVMLRGLEIIAALPSLRPYGAEVGMMQWWNHRNGGRRVATRRQKRNQASSSAAAETTPLGWVPYLTWRQLRTWFFAYVPLAFLVRTAKVSLWLPVLGTSAMKLVDWLLPVAVSAYGVTVAAATVPASPLQGHRQRGGEEAGPCHSPTRAATTASTSSSSPAWSVGAFRLLAAMDATRQWVSSLLDIGRVVDVILRNGYKASVLARLRDSRFWEPTAEIEAKMTAGATTSATAERLQDNSNFSMSTSVLGASVAFAGHQAARLLAHDGKGTNPGSSTSITADFTVQHIRVRGLQFRYPTAPTVDVYPQPLSLDLPLVDTSTGRGRLVCLVGPSGCGKSTLLSLLLGLYAGAFQPSPEGDIAEDTAEDAVMEDPIVLSLAHPSRSTKEVPLHAISPQVLRTHLFSFVPQYPTIFAGATIAHNISLQDFVSLEEVTVLDRAAACAERAHCAEFIDRFPQGLLTHITDAAGSNASADCVRLSGGQAQRLMMARALYHSSGVLLMDEPTASLDMGIKEALLKEYRTLLDSGAVRGILCATHDPKVIALADEVVHCGLPPSTTTPDGL